MIKALAQGAGLRMPSFGGYILKWVLPYYLPIILLMWMVFVAQDYRIRATGIIVAVVRVAFSVYGDRKKASAG
jgi:hypothetical protein